MAYYIIVEVSVSAGLKIGLSPIETGQSQITEGTRDQFWITSSQSRPYQRSCRPHQQWQGPLLLLRSLAIRLRDGERSNSSWTSELWGKQKKIAERKNTKRQKPSVSLTKHRRSEQHHKGRQHAGRLQPVREDNMSSVFVNLNCCFTSNMLVFHFSFPDQFSSTMAPSSKEQTASSQDQLESLVPTLPRRKRRKK